MARLASACPGYGFESHKGYSVPQHLAALRELGPTVHHRRSFAPIAALLRGEAIVEQEAFAFMAADEVAAG
jgi:ribonuclease HII